MNTRARVGCIAMGLRRAGWLETCASRCLEYHTTLNPPPLHFSRDGGDPASSNPCNARSASTSVAGAMPSQGNHACATRKRWLPIRPFTAFETCIALKEANISRSSGTLSWVTSTSASGSKSRITGATWLVVQPSVVDRVWNPRGEPIVPAAARAVDVQVMADICQRTLPALHPQPGPLTFLQRRSGFFWEPWGAEVILGGYARSGSPALEGAEEVEALKLLMV